MTEITYFGFPVTHFLPSMAILYPALWLDMALNFTYPLLFDLVFKSGEFYGDEGSFWKDFIMPVFTAALGAGIGAFVTWKVFRDTLKAGRDNELNTTNKLERERLLYLDFLITNSISFMQSYLKGMKMFIDAIKPKAIEMPPLNLPHTYDIKRMTFDTNREQHFHAYRVQIKDANIFSIFSAIDYFERIKDEIEKGMEKNIKTYYEKQAEFQKGMEIFSVNLYKYKKNLKENEKLYPAESQIIVKAYSEYVKISTEDITNQKAVIENVVKPIIVFNNKNNNTSKEYQNISDLGQRILMLSEPIILLNEYCKNQIVQYSMDITSELIKLIHAHKPLQDYRNAIIATDQFTNHT